MGAHVCLAPKLELYIVVSIDQHVGHASTVWHVQDFKKLYGSVLFPPTTKQWDLDWREQWVGVGIQMRTKDFEELLVTVNNCLFFKSRSLCGIQVWEI